MSACSALDLGGSSCDTSPISPTSFHRRPVVFSHRQRRCWSSTMMLDHSANTLLSTLVVRGSTIVRCACVRAKTSPEWSLTTYVGPPYCLAEMYSCRVACCPLVSHGEYADGADRRTNGWTPDRHITLPARRNQRSKRGLSMNPRMFTTSVVPAVSLPRQLFGDLRIGLSTGAADCDQPTRLNCHRRLGAAARAIPSPVIAVPGRELA